MRRSASEIIRNLERRIARLEKQSSVFEYKTIGRLQGKKINLSRGATLFFAFVDSEGNAKPVSWKQWSKSSLPDQSSDLSREDMKKALISKAKKGLSFGEMMEVNNYRGDFIAIMKWLSSKGINVSARGIKIARQSSNKIARVTSSDLKQWFSPRPKKLRVVTQSGSQLKLKDVANMKGVNLYVYGIHADGDESLLMLHIDERGRLQRGWVDGLELG